ncbi:hypothetical protein CROQUDRAFT_663017 [Cronartium quercuum f. sp. fusiforme G11]|uniref:MICOS complex subunit n=1 Tax=Cronartium quercuum f. sp. fusiforme G11 TaxID=708437 RepID=A0A9P6T7H9_9BASI|nr:hypothetical protein CROQUDRAFT_663017 [Cronartium quercuum f. sp. fusiforme G11]
MSSTPSAATHEHSTQHISRFKLPIYDEPSEELVLIKTELPLQAQVRTVRTELEAFRKHLGVGTQNGLERWLEVEKRVSEKVRSLVDEREATPTAALYVAIGTLTGSIVSRRRAFPLRFLSPLAFFLVSSSQFVPHTSQNVKRYVFELQDRHFPGSARLRDQTTARVMEGVEWARALKERVWRRTEEAVRDGSGAVERLSGLKVDSGRRS